MISSFTPNIFLLALLLLEFPELLLFLLEFDDFVELGEDVEVLLDAEFALALFALLLLLFELLLPPELEDPDDPPEDCFSFLSLLIIHTVVDHLLINFLHTREIETSSFAYFYTSYAVLHDSKCFKRFHQLMFLYLETSD